MTVATLALVCHPDAPDFYTDGIVAKISREADGGLLGVWRLDADLAALRIPDAPLDPERLWAHSCFELFVATPGAAAYREFNFSPNGQWMRFDFCAYRQRAEPRADGGATGIAGAQPRIALERGADFIALSVHLPAALLPPGDLAIGVSAVVEHRDGSHHYWALRHPAGKPDFHHREGLAFALKAAKP